MARIRVNIESAILAADGPWIFEKAIMVAFSRFYSGLAIVVHP